MERQPLHGADDSVRCGEVRLKVFDLKKGLFAPRTGKKGLSAPRTGKQRHVYSRFARRGSSASRSPSPSRFTASTVTDRNSAGKKTIYGFTCHNARPSAMMLPQLGMIGGVPAPMNDNVASVIIAAAQMNVACTISGASVLGRMCFQMITGTRVPEATAAST